MGTMTTKDEERAMEALLALFDAWRYEMELSSDLSETTILALIAEHCECRLVGPVADGRPH